MLVLPVERIIENLEQKDKDNLSYAKDLAKSEAKANKYDSLVEKIKNKDKEVEYRLNETMITERDMQFNLGKKTILQELLDTES